MKRFWSAAGVALAVVGAPGLAGPASAGVPVPFFGSLAGVDTGTPIPNTQLASVTVRAVGNATQLGQFTYTALITVNTATGEGSGTFLFTGANGNTVFGTIRGQSTFRPPNVLSISETATVTGGTGRFAGATGSLAVTRLKNTVTGATSASFKGTISAPGP